MTPVRCTIGVVSDNRVRTNLDDLDDRFVTKQRLDIDY